MSAPHIKFRVTTVHKGDYFTATCPFLNVVTQGETEQLALKNLKEEILFLFEVCKEKGTIKEMLEVRITNYKRTGSFMEDIGFAEVADKQWLDVGVPIEAMEQITEYGGLRGH